MRVAKEEVKKMLESLPNDAFEDIQYHIYVQEKIKKGLLDVKEGRVFSQKEAESRMSKRFVGALVFESKKTNDTRN
jgi:predicted transcriptional regulator